MPIQADLANKRWRFDKMSGSYTNRASEELAKLDIAKIVWEGNQPWEKEFPDIPLPKGAAKIKRPDNLLSASVPYGIVPMILCFIAVIVKKSASTEFLFDLRFMPIGFLIGFLLIPVHEYIHAICYPKEATVYVGVCIQKVAAYAVSGYPISKCRYIIMSLAPVLLGIIPLCIFLICPLKWKGLLTSCLVPLFMGLISPSPDYMDVIKIMKQVPSGAKIQATNEGLFWFM